MVARDGIEPPTPAFSGPRSTTELSGLGGELQEGTAATGSCRILDVQNLKLCPVALTQYINAFATCQIFTFSPEKLCSVPGLDVALHLAYAARREGMR